MLRQIGQWLVKLWQRFRGIFRKRQEAPPSQGLTDAERERLFLQLLNIVDKFGQVEVLRCVETLKQRSAEAEWVTWLQKFGERLLESPAPNRELGQRMVKLGEVGCGELGEIAREIATQLLARELPPGEEAPTTEINVKALVLYQRGVDLNDQNDRIGALDCFDRAIDLQSDFHYAWNGKGHVLIDLGRNQEALESFDRAIALQSEEPVIWNGKGIVLRQLERYEDAIIAYNCALQLTNNQYWEAWANRGWAVFYSPLRGYDAAIENWDEGLRAIQSTADPEANATLHKEKGEAHYRHGRLQSNPYTFWREGRLSYLEALKCLVVPSDASPKTGFLDSHNAFGTLRAPKLRLRYLEILKGLAKVCSALGRSAEAEECLSVGEVMLEQLLREIPLKDRTKLAMKFATFHQLRVDLLAQSPEPAKQIVALELAEARKNLCLRLLRQGWSDAPPESPNYQEIQRELLNPHTAAIYWHLSDTSLTTFILCDGAAPSISMLRDTDPTATVKLHEFEAWMERWKSNYQLYRKDAKEATADNKETWREEMLDELDKLAKYLKIKEILDSLQTLPQAVTELILIPHRDLHLLPLEYLFRDSPFTLTRLPSAQTGIELQKLHTPTERQLLSIENPSTTKPLRYAEIEAVAVSQLYDASQDNRIRGKEANKENVILKLETAFADVLLFTGHGYHKPDDPLESGLILANDRPLTLKDIFEVKFAKNYYLVCLSACETGLTSQANLLDEFVGLASGFLAKRSLYVVATLWTVKEISAAFLMIEFHRSLVLEKKAPPLALKQAQTWLRTVCDRDLAIWCHDRATEISSRDRKCSDHLKTQALTIEEDLKKDIMKSSQCRYSHPYYWAGFAIAGKIN